MRSQEVAEMAEERLVTPKPTCCCSIGRPLAETELLPQSPIPLETFIVRRHLLHQKLPKGKNTGCLDLRFPNLSVTITRSSPGPILVSKAAGLGWGPRLCMTDKLPRDAQAASLRTALGEPLAWSPEKCLSLMMCLGQKGGEVCMKPEEKMHPCAPSRGVE